MNQRYGSMFATAAMLTWPVSVSGDCFSRFMTLRAEPSNSIVGGRDNHGNPVNIRNATAMTYDLCLKTCGGGIWSIGGSWDRWQTSTQSLSQWLFPFLALTSQLPLGKDTKFENFMSVLLTIGSPTLAADSVTLTVLNSRWVHRRFSDISFPNGRAAAWVLNNFQQSPLRVTANDYLLGSLIVLPDNDRWWSELAAFLNPDHHYSWSFSNVTSVIWVVLSFLLTVMNSFADTPTEAALSPYNGLALAFCWIWLLAILICSLNNAPRCDKTALHEALRRANRSVYVAAHNGNCDLGHFTVNRPPLSLDSPDVPLRMDHHRGAPIYSYARLVTWGLAVKKVHAAFQAASSGANKQLPVNSRAGWSKNRKGELALSNRRGSPAQVADYIQSRDHKILLPDLGWRSLNSSVMALFLTWGTIGPAVVLDLALPTKGLGCRSASRLAYGILSIVIWALMVTSNRSSYNWIISDSISDTSRHGNVKQSLSRLFAIVLRRTGKVLSCINATWIVVTFVLECTDVYQSCWCNSDVLYLGSHAYSVMLWTREDFHAFWTPLVTSTVLASASVVIFTGINIHMNPSSSRWFASIGKKSI
ncbi:hypothetical protein DFH08DRAFT_925191 [Mycena albidolilacea]|uniref:Uncharacterized protein n=1 Tax=Mycena albidolilacea TaxID=1033008 RepID=A0AAD7ENH4_9AGAR|nr:hypothetical protein DFH08DRAFT_925191 [Mycena albidolilacea]